MMNTKQNFQHTIYACYLGYITQAVVNNLAPLLFVILIDTFQLFLMRITLLTTVNFLTQLCVDLLAAHFSERIGYRTMAVGAHLFSALGLFAMASLPYCMDPFAALLIACVLYAVGGGLIEVIISPIVEACPSENKAAAMSLLHSFYCWGSVAVILISTLLLHIAGKQHWQMIPMLWMVLPLLNVVWFTKVPINTLTEKNEGMKVYELLKNRMFWIYFALMIASGASELSMSQWASAFAERGLHISKTAGDLAGPCFFAFLMGTSRLIYGRKGGGNDLLKWIRNSSLLCIVSYLLAALSPLPFLSLLGCGLCGLSVGIFWPGVFSIASMNMPKGGTALFALLALAGDVGCSLGPTAVGFCAGLFQDDLKIGLLCAGLFPIILLISIRLLEKEGVSYE